LARSSRRRLPVSPGGVRPGVRRAAQSQPQCGHGATTLLDPLGAPMHHYIYPPSESGSVRCTPLPPPGCASSGLRTPTALAPCSPQMDDRRLLTSHLHGGPALLRFRSGQVCFSAVGSTVVSRSLGGPHLPGILVFRDVYKWLALLCHLAYSSVARFK
jgi:hypothetical protein